MIVNPIQVSLENSCSICQFIHRTVCFPISSHKTIQTRSESLKFVYENLASSNEKAGDNSKLLGWKDENEENNNRSDFHINRFEY